MPPAPRSKTLELAGRIIPGIDRVHAQVEPYAEAWRTANAEALRSDDGPLLVALGDSMTQGVGASSYRGGWLGQVQTRLARNGTPYRVVNLSSTGARIADVTRDQLAALRELPQQPDVVTLLIGANDMVRRSRRAAAVAQFAELLDALPVGPRSVVAMLPRRNPESLAINELIRTAAAAGRVSVTRGANLRLRDIWGTLADDFFHPNEVGYAHLADAFYDVIAQ